MVSVLSWYQWTESEWVEEAKQKLRDRAEASRQRRTKSKHLDSASDISSASTSNDELLQRTSEDDDISFIDDKSIAKINEEIEELMAVAEVRQPKKSKNVLDVKVIEPDESAC